MSSEFDLCNCNSSPAFSFEYFIRKDSSQTKIVAPRTPFMMVTNATNCLTVVPKYFEIIAGIVDPSFLKDMNPEKKSCVAPIKIVPKVIHKKL